MEKNILIGRCSSSFFSDAHICKIKKEASINNLYAIVGYLDQISSYQSASFCFWREDCLLGRYDRYTEKLGLRLLPLDAPILTAIQHFLTEAMLMQRRFETRIPLWISPNLKDHYWLAMKQVLFWHSFLKERKIQTVVFADVPHEAYDTIIFELCKIMGIETIIYRSFYKTDRFFVFSDYPQMALDVSMKRKRLEESFKDGSSSSIALSRSVEAFYNALNSQTPDGLLFKKEALRSEEFYYRFGATGLKQYIQNYSARQRRFSQIPTRIKNEYGTVTPTTFWGKTYDFLRCYRFIQKKKRQTDYLDREYENLASGLNWNDKYVYFALHLLPESAVMPLGTPFSEQYWAILMLSQSLPNDWFLYVKMHPAQVATMISIEDIKRMKLLRNVKIVSRYANQFDLIKNCQAVATLTGEVAIEALFLNKYSLLFGNTYYSSSPLSFRISSTNDLVTAISQISSKEASCSDYEKRLFFRAIEEVTYSGIGEVVQEIINRIGRENTNGTIARTDSNWYTAFV